MYGIFVRGLYGICDEREKKRNERDECDERDERHEREKNAIKNKIYLFFAVFFFIKILLHAPYKNPVQKSRTLLGPTT